MERSMLQQELWTEKLIFLLAVQKIHNKMILAKILKYKLYLIQQENKIYKLYIIKYLNE